MPLVQLVQFPAPAALHVPVKYGLVLMYGLDFLGGMYGRLGSDLNEEGIEGVDLGCGWRRVGVRLGTAY